MITMTLRLTVPPEKTMEAIRIVDSIGGSVSAEPDCRLFILYRETANDDALMLCEEWETWEALEDHIRSKRFKRILILIDLALEPPDVRIDTLSESAGFELISILRSGQESTFALQ